MLIYERFRQAVRNYGYGSDESRYRDKDVAWLHTSPFAFGPMRRFDMLHIIEVGCGSFGTTKKQ